MNPPFSSDSGAALVSITWIVLLLSILAVGLLTLTLTTAQDAKNTADEIKRVFLVQSAMDIFLARYFYDEDELVFREGTLRVLEEEVGFQVEHESGKVNLNRSGIELLSLVFAYQGLSENEALEIASAIIDWRDRDSEALILGAEADTYLDAGLVASPRNGPFESIGELMAVKGMSLSLFNCVRPFFTVYSRYPTVNYTDASPDMLKILQWGFDNKWQGYSWADPALEILGDTGASSASELGGKALKLVIQPSSNPPETYSATIRFKGTSDNAFSTLKPLSKELEYSVEQACSVI